MRLPEELRKQIEALGISPDLPEYDLLLAIDAKETEIGYDSNWEITDVGFAIEKLYDAVLDVIDSEAESK